MSWIRQDKHHIVALVAERPIDRGRLMICTYRLRDHLGTHPAAIS